MTERVKGVLTKESMKEEDVDKILNAADKGFQVAGFRSFEDAVDHAHKLLERILGMISVATTRESARQALLESPDWSAEELEKVTSSLPNLVYIIRGLLPQTISDIPHAPGGRPEALTGIKKKQVCAEIASLYGEGVLLGDAFKRLAKRFGVSESTIRRAWRERASLTQRKPKAS